MRSTPEGYPRGTTRGVSPLWAAPLGVVPGAPSTRATPVGPNKRRKKEGRQTGESKSYV